MNVGGESAPYRSTVALHLSHNAAALPLLSLLFVKLSTAKYTTASKIKLIVNHKTENSAAVVAIKYFFFISTNVL